MRAPPDAARVVGYIARRPDRPERLALFHADGRLSNSYASDMTFDAVRWAVLAAGLEVDRNGIVRRPAPEGDQK